MRRFYNAYIFFQIQNGSFKVERFMLERLANFTDSIIENYKFLKEEHEMWNRIKKFINGLAEGFIIGNRIVANGGCCYM